MKELSIYRKIIEQYPLLSKEREYAALDAFQNGRTERAKSNGLDLIVKSNLRLVIAQAMKYRGRDGVEVSDLVQEGAAGLVKAAERFDLSKGLKFSTFAVYWIKQAMTRYIKGKSRTVFVPEYVMNDADKVSKFESKFLTETGRAPTEDEVARGTGLTGRALSAARNASKTELSTNAAVGKREEGAATEFGDLLSDRGASSPRDPVSDSDVSDGIAKALSVLTPSERTVVRLRFGIGDGQPMSKGEIASLLRTPEKEIEKALSQANLR